MNSITLVENGNYLDVYSPYNESFVAEIRNFPQRKARWDESQINPKTGKPKFKCWSVRMVDLLKLSSALHTYYSILPIQIWYAGKPGPEALKPGMKYAHELLTPPTQAPEAQAVVVTWAQFAAQVPAPSAMPETKIDPPVKAEDESWARSAFDKTPIPEPTPQEIDEKVTEAIMALWD